jgi:hypothetical protein
MNLENLREDAKKLCREFGVNVIPYATGWWLIGDGINRVVGELAGLGKSDLTPLPIIER